MADILDASGQKLATLGDDMRVHDLSYNQLGYIVGSDVHEKDGDKVGYVGSNGYVYRGSSHVGTVHPDGTVYDYNNHLVGKVVGGHIESGGAALLLLVL